MTVYLSKDITMTMPAPTPVNFPQRDGVTELIKIGKTMCRIVTAFKPIILSKYSDVPTIIALLTSIEATCGLLPDAIADFYDPGGLNTDIAADPGSTPGINPGAPEPPALPE